MRGGGAEGDRGCHNFKFEPRIIFEELCYLKVCSKNNPAKSKFGYLQEVGDLVRGSKFFGIDLHFHSILAVKNSPQLQFEDTSPNLLGQGCLSYLLVAKMLAFGTTYRVLEVKI